MLPELLYSEESYALSIDKKNYDVYVLSFWLNDRHCFRVYIDNEASHLFTWDAPSATLQQMDGREAISRHLHKALSEKILNRLKENSLVR